MYFYKIMEMNGMKKTTKILLGAAMLAAAFLGAGCGGSDSKSTQAKGIPSVIRVGSETTFPPFEFTKDDKYVGFDLDLADAMIKQMGSQMEFKSMGFDALIPAVQSGQIDLIAAGLDATPEREKHVAFSDPYFTDNGYIIIVRKDNDAIKDWADLNGKTVGAQVGTHQVNLAQEAKASQVKQLDSNSQAFMELQAKTLDAVLIDKPVGMYYLKQGGDKELKIVGSTKEANGMVFAVNKENKELQAAVNKALKEIKANGTYDKIYEKWFGKREQK